MELRDVRGMGRATEEKLNAAGVTSAAELAWVDDLAALAGRTGIPVGELASLRLEAARPDRRPIRPRPRMMRGSLALTGAVGARLLEAMGFRPSSRAFRSVDPRGPRSERSGSK